MFNMNWLRYLMCRLGVITDYNQFQRRIMSHCIVIYSFLQTYPVSRWVMKIIRFHFWKFSYDPFFYRVCAFTTVLSQFRPGKSLDLETEHFA